MNANGTIHRIKSTTAPVIEPQGEIVLIRRQKPEEKGSIILPDSVERPNILAVVVALGTSTSPSHKAEVGDTIIVGPGAKGIDLGAFDMGDDHFLINQAEILAIVK